jgi:PTH1 family peptidyl-tRNA hydrolase
VAGLGNPGPAYAHTRHNVGYAVVERLAAGESAAFVADAHEAQVARVRVASFAVLLLKPQTFMNRSGAAVAGWLAQLGLPASRLVVVHDDLDLPLGRLRIVEAAGPGGHRGVRSVQEALGTAEFTRVRVGIGRPEAGADATERVLAEFSADERSVLCDAVAKAAEAVRHVIADGPVGAMNRYNARPRSGPQRERRRGDQPATENGNATVESRALRGKS